ncbi:related to Mitochondrial intermembrane space import and assembly protein 40 [Cephalotrichum gorgonifer]|uniref:Mitochondrial intermembrane space import and assembly protein 40 n=1 Tax=Cephalotrichum gorgonifer TaxID=2041049 RepID=A0AAE8MWK0_9PEZI|nr:related to Mitochondrial intermembrane space import and assembly protein 40 [Cephalotrichum gorgonifer]
MFRAPLRRLRPTTLPATRFVAAVPRRAASTSSGAAKKGTWKGAVARWGIAGGALYWYWTSPLFADDPPPRVIAPPVTDEEVTVDKVIDQKRKEIEARAKEREAKEAAKRAAAEEKERLEAKAKAQAADAAPTTPAVEAETAADAAPVPAADDGSAQPQQENDPTQQAAYNPETGEINWDCPCLGGMAHGPCGEQFRDAFSCFVHSEEEPKGMDCIDKFQAMQDCFRQHPDVYGAELEEEEAEIAAAAKEEEGAAGVEAPAATQKDDAAPAAAAPSTEAAVKSPETTLQKELASKPVAKPDEKTES